MHIRRWNSQGRSDGDREERDPDNFFTSALVALKTGSFMEQTDDHG